MVERVEIERLEGSSKPMLIELFTQAFEEYPLIPVHRLVPEPSEKLKEISSKFADLLLKFAFSFHMNMKSSFACGIRSENKLVSAILCVDSKDKPSFKSWIQLIAFGVRFNIYLSRLARFTGKHRAKNFGKFFQRIFYKEKPQYEDKYVELVLFGTLPAYQRQGYGRKLLYYLYDKAKMDGYKGVILLTGCDTPAYRLYLNEGFIVDKEFEFEGIKICWMRLIFNNLLTAQNNWRSTHL